MPYKINGVDFPIYPMDKNWSRNQIDVRGDGVPVFSSFWTLNLNFGYATASDIDAFIAIAETRETFTLYAPHPIQHVSRSYAESSITEINYSIMDVENNGFVSGFSVTFRVPIDSTGGADRQRFFLCYHIPDVLLSGTIQYTPDFEMFPVDRSRIHYSSSTNLIADDVDKPKAGQTVVIKDGTGRSLGYLRLRGMQNDNPVSYLSGFILVGENTSVSRNQGYTFEILRDWRMWPKHPRTEIELGEPVFYEDYDLLLTPGNEETVNWRPVANPGPPAIGIINNTFPTAQIEFVGEHSWATAPGASIASVQWYFYGSNETLPVTTLGTDASPVTAAYTTAGKHLVELRVTDTVGNQSVAYTWVWIIDERVSESSQPYTTDFLNLNWSVDFNSGGGQANVTLYDNASDTIFQDSQLVVIGVDGEQDDYNGWTGRENTWFVGYIEGGSISVNKTDNTTSFTIKTLDAIMKNTYCYPASLNELPPGSTPANWTQGVGITVNRLISFVAQHRSTLSLMCPIVKFPDDIPLYGQDLGFGTLHGQLQNEVMNGVLGGKVAFDSQGVLRFTRDYNLMITAEQSAIPNRKEMFPNHYVGQISVQKRDTFFTPVSKVAGEGVVYNGSGDPETALPLISEAPAFVSAPFGSEKSVSRLALVSQEELNERTGRVMGKDNAKWVSVSMNFINDRDYNVGKQNPHLWSINAEESLLGYQTGFSIIPRSVSAQADLENQVARYDVSFEPLTGGVTAQTVNVPDPPAPNGSGSGVPDIPPEPVATLPTPDGVPNGDLLAGVVDSGVYYLTADSNPLSWDDRNAGLILGTVKQVGFDPWWQQKGGNRLNTTDRSQAIIWCCSHGKVWRSENCGISSWDDVTPASNPPDDWSDGPAPTVSTVTYALRTDNIHQNGHHYILVNYTNASGLYRSWILKSTDDGASWAWHSVAGGLNSYLFSEVDWAEVTVNGSGYVYGDELDYVDGQGVYINEGNYLRATPANPGLLANTTFSYSTVRGYYRTNRVGIVYTDTTQDYGDPVGAPSCDENSIGSLLVSPTKVVDHFYVYITPYAAVGGGNACMLNWEASTPGEVMSLWADVDTEDGTLVYTTIWTEGALYLHVRSTADMTLIRAVSLGDCTKAELDAKTYFAAPYTPPFNKDEVYVYGRVSNPVGLTGVYHLLKSTDQGQTWTAISSNIASDWRMTAFNAGWDNIEAGKRQYYATVVDPVGGNVYMYEGINEILPTSGLETTDISGTYTDAVTYIEGSIAVGGTSSDGVRVAEIDTDFATESLEGDLPEGDVSSLVYV